MGHWSDCSIHNEPALPAGPCDCGGLNLADDCLNHGIAAFISMSGGVRLLVNHMGGEGFIEPHVLPPLALMAIASTANLPNMHEFITILGKPDDMNLHDAREAVISQLKALLGSQCLASSLSPHVYSPSDGLPDGA